MPGITQYLIETTLCLAVFYGFYHFFFRKNRLSRFNRWYLLIAPILSVIIPGLDLVLFFEDIFSAAYANEFLLSQSENLHLAVADKIEDNTPPIQLKINDLFKIIYLLGVAFLGFKFIDKYWNWVLMFQKQKPDWYVGYTLDNPYFIFPNTSLFSFLFWNKKILPEPLKNKLRSRKIKLNGFHSLDVILMNGMLVLLWFHPMIYWFKRELADWHEGYLKANLKESNVKDFKNLSHFRPLLSITPLFFLLSIFSTNLTDEITPFQQINALSDNIENITGTVLFEYEKEKPAVYSLKWGEVNIPLEKVAAPNGFSGKIEMELYKFQMIADSSLTVFKNDEKQDFQTLDVQLKKSESGRTLWFPNVNPDSMDLINRRKENVKNYLEKGDELSVMSKVGDIYLAGVKIKITDPSELYLPEISVPPIRKNHPEFGFQLVNKIDGNALIRIDTLNPETKHILDLYRDNEKFEIIHIPDFKTNKRVIGQGDILFPNTEDIILAGNPIENIYELPEYQGFQNNLVRMFWGKMIAGPISKNYTVEQFKRDIRRPIQLKISDELLEVVNFRMIVVPAVEPPKSFVMSPDDLEHYKVEAELNRMRPETSIYFEKIVIRDNGILKQFPISFLINVGNDYDKYDLAIAESQPGLKKEARRDMGYLFYQNYPLSELISVLTGNERMVFESDFPEPKLDILFQSPRISTDKGESLILQKIREQFYYQTEMRFETRDVWVLQSPDNQGKLEDFEYYYNIRPNLDEVIKKNKKKGLETITPGFFDDLANLIEDRFNVIVFNETELEKAYGLGLNMSSLKALKRQLKRDYGIELKKEERVVRMVKVKL